MSSVIRICHQDLSSGSMINDQCDITTGAATTTKVVLFINNLTPSQLFTTYSPSHRNLVPPPPRCDPLLLCCPNPYHSLLPTVFPCPPLSLSALHCVPVLSSLLPYHPLGHTAALHCFTLPSVQSPCLPFGLSCPPLCPCGLHLVTLISTQSLYQGQWGVAYFPYQIEAARAPAVL